MSAIFFSIVIPIYNEEENIPELYRRLTAVMEKLCGNKENPENGFEIIMVNDGSTDRSWHIIKELHEKDSRVKGISFSRNFGHHVAITAGLDHAKGNAIILMDGDLQDPPEEIPKLYAKFIEGYDLVYGIREKNKETFFKKLASSLFWHLINKLSGVYMPENQTLLRIFDKKILDVLRTMRERSRFIHGMIAWTGFKVGIVKVEHASRLYGISKYNAVKMFRLAFNAITSFSTTPLRLATYLGFISAGIGFFFGVYFLYKKIAYGIPVLGYASIIVAILFIGGIQLLILGIIGEYLGRTYQEVQGRPIYIIGDRLL